MNHILCDNEAERIAALNYYQVLGTPPEPAFDEITQLVAALCGAPISMISLTDRDRQWFKSRVGVAIDEAPRGNSFCSHAIERPEILIVPDAWQDKRFSQNLLVTGEAQVRFYAGAPLLSPSGHALGTLCVLDTVPRTLSPQQQSALQILASQVVAQLELRLRTPAPIPDAHGDKRAGTGSGFRDMDQSGKTGHAGLEVDITQCRQIEEAARRSEARFIALSNSAPFGIFESDIQGNCLYTNPQWHQMTGLTLVESSGTKWWNGAHPDDRGDVSTVWEICAEQGHDFYMEFRFLRPKGQICWVRSHAAAVYSETGEITSYVGTAADITEYKQHQRQIEEQVMYIQDNSVQLEMQRDELEALNAKLQALAVTDSLTGLKNHRAFQERLADEFERSTRYHKPLSLLLLDVDRFKHYNDTFGHPAGDQVLKMVAALLQQSVRTTDFVARYGGEEFIILLPETDADGAMRLAERVRAAIAAHPWQERSVTISIGAAALQSACAAAAVLMEQADQALYASKTGGRNRVTLFGAR